jgi:hypothetical protein
VISWHGYSCSSNKNEAHGLPENWMIGSQQASRALRHS